MAKTNSISLADYMEKFVKSKSGQKCMAALNAKRDAHPAKFELQYDFELTNLSMEMAGRIKILNYLQNILTPAAGYNADDLTNEQVDEIWDRRTKEIYALHAAQVKYENRKAELENAVLEFDEK
jgi:hypothetical protein